jgi:hypothetical protein
MDDDDVQVILEPHSVLAPDHEDGGILTHGLMARLERYCHVQTMNGMSSIVSVPLNVLSPLVHVQQRDSYSCGYRNVQMLLSSVLHLLPDDHVLFCRLKIPAVRRQSMTVTLPTILQIQDALESAWERGYDPKGAAHFHSKISGSKSRIGAIEVASLLEYLDMDCAVVQFIHCEESRRQLGPFLWNYYSSKHPMHCAMQRVHVALHDASNHDRNISNNSNSSDEISQRKKAKLSDSISHPWTCPVYLQWRGHSITVVGVERLMPCNVQKNSYRLLVLDPVHPWSSERGIVSCKTPFPFPLENLSDQDVQIIIVTTAHERDKEAMTRKSCRVVTARDDLVMKYMYR